MTMFGGVVSRKGVVLDQKLKSVDVQRSAHLPAID
jgi:hypothetical protein